MEISRRSYIGGRSSSAGNFSDPFHSSEDDLPSTDTPSVNGGGIEVIPRRPVGDSLNRNDSVAHRSNGVTQAIFQVGEDIANKLLPPEESELMLRRYEKRADERIRRTYLEGLPMREVDESAPVPVVGLTFLPGADKPQVTRLEQIGMTGQPPDQNEAIWRVNTAASLLMQFNVSADLSIVQSYEGAQTSKVAGRVRKRLGRNSIDLVGQHSNQSSSTLGRRTSGNSMSLSLMPKQDRVTIDSQHVHIVHDLREREWDLESTLIEVDGSSITKLVVNFRHLISRGGPEMTTEETCVLLDTMIEDARRLCVRSPVLFRMSTRDKIINSTDTRYGINHGGLFRTLTTSQGIKEIISLSASYFNSLDPDSGKDMTQKQIRPRFLQMIVLLLSLLNDEDLGDIKEFLESTYKLMAERKHLELLFLKVIPLQSINSKVFLNAMIPAIEAFPLNPAYGSHNEIHWHLWDVFVQRILGEGYLVPGGIVDLNREEHSWIVKWPEDGFKSTAVFNCLQYSGSLKTINEISPIEFHPEASLSELTVTMTNNDRYLISSNDLDKITCLTPGVYSVTEIGQTAEETGRNYDLVITEHHINRELTEAIRKTNIIVNHMNSLSTLNRKRFKERFSAGLGRRVSEIIFLQECRGSGRLTRSSATLNQDALAIAYKVEGRKIARRDAMRSLTHDIQAMDQLLSQIERRMPELSSQAIEKTGLRDILEEVRNHVAIAEKGRQVIGSQVDISDEPIAKVLYPGGIDPTAVHVWKDYKAWYCDKRLHIEAMRATVGSVRWITDTDIEVSLEGRAIKYFVTPLSPVEEAVRGDEIDTGDTIVLAGGYMIVAEKADWQEDRLGDRGEECSMLNYLKITSVEEQSSSRRRMNRPKLHDMILTIFR